MKTISQLKLFVLLLLLSIGAVGCSEKDDFIPEPTATSVIVTGVVTTSSGSPLANLHVSIDYHENYWLGPVKTIHKAKGKTDSNGRYRLFFEPEDDKSNLENSPSQTYFICADLSGLSSDVYLMPSDFNEEMGARYSCGISGILKQGEKLDINLFFPQKKEVRTELKHFVADQNLQIKNEIRFGTGNISLGRNVGLDADGNGEIVIPCALDEVNLISVYDMDKVKELCGPKEITVTELSESPVIFDNEEVPDSCRFKLTLYSCSSFNGKEYPDDAEYRTPSPFDFLGFRIVNPEGKYEIQTKRYQYYDSIIWSSPDFPETFRIYDRKSTESSSSERLTSQWGSYFFFSGHHTTVLTAFKNGRAVYSDSITFDLEDRDFLCFDWNNFVYLTEHGTIQNTYCRLDGNNEYNIRALANADGEKSVDIYLNIRGHLDTETLLNWQQIRLENLMFKHLGHWKEYDESTIHQLFKQLPEDDIPVKLYENETTRAIVMHSPATEDNSECYYIHAEPKEQ